MPFDMFIDHLPDPGLRNPPAPSVAAPDLRRRQRGQRAYHAGLAAEQAVERHFLGRGHVLAARRWRGKQGEIDLIFLCKDQVVFVEVKQSTTHDLAMQALMPAQIRRIHDASNEYVHDVLERPFIDRQYHLAMVDGAGRIALESEVFFLM